jgi:rod shape-determining protein MreC
VDPLKQEGDPKLKKKTSLNVVVVAVVTIIVIVLAIFGSVSNEVSYPIQRITRGVVRYVIRPIGGAFNAVAVKAENESLKRQIASLAMVQEDAMALIEENDRLRKFLGYRKKMNGTWIAASVLSEGGGALGVGKFLRIDKGSLAGVDEGAVVALPQGLVGRIRSVSLHTSEVLLLTDASVKVSCEIEGSNGALGVLSGGTDNMLSLEYIKKGTKAPTRARVLTSGKGGVFPDGHLVGFLIDLSESADGVSVSAKVRPAVDFSQIEDVFVRDEK